MGYTGIFVMMFLESSFFPFPSEVAMVPAGYLAAQGQMSLVAAFLAGAGGSLTGALFNYWIGHKLGHPFLLKYGRYLLIKPETIEKVETFFARHGPASTFWGRLIPGIRQYISLPAGIGKMAMVPFAVYTFLGAGIWCAVLLSLGYLFGNDTTAIHHYTAWALAVIFGAMVLFLLVYRKKTS
jgi:membrane protein DedA with SNARE-associated domain